MNLTTSLTVETSFESSNDDMGKTHTLIHNKQHNYLQDGEPLVEELTDTNLDDDGVELAIKKMQELGIRDEKEWKEYNSGLAKSRRKDSYVDYLRSLASPLVKGKKALLAQSVEEKKDSSEKGKPHVSGLRRQKLQRELYYIEEKNEGLPIWSSLVYVGSADDYLGKTSDEIKEIRGAKADALRNWHNSKKHALLHPGEFRSELHYDEAGDIHAQSQEVFPYIDGRGRQQISQFKAQEQALVSLYGSKEAFERNLTLLCACHRLYSAKKGGVRADAEFLRQKLAMNGKGLNEEAFYRENGIKNKITARERRYRVAELVRVEDMANLMICATQAFKARGIDWKVNLDYVTDGVHQTGAEYKASFDKRAKLASQSAQISSNQEELDNITKNKKTASDELSVLNTAIKAKKDEKKKLDDDVASSQSKLDELNKQHDEAFKKLQDLRNAVQAEKLEREKEAKKDEERKKLYQKREDQLREKGLELDTFTTRVDEQKHTLKVQGAQIAQNKKTLALQQKRLDGLKLAVDEVVELVWEGIKQSARLSLYKVYRGFVDTFKKQAKTDVKAGSVREKSEFETPELNKRTVHEALEEADTSKLSPQGQKLVKAVEAQTKPKKDDVDRVMDIIYGPDSTKRVNEMLKAKARQSTSKVSDVKPKKPKEKDQGPTL